ncbi:MAG: DNA polymerase [Halobacteriota archaeon]|nr:DNA polymerase [Halobacteriota archaeon]
MQVTGEGRLRILIISEAPGKEEDLQNKQLIGQAGQKLRFYLKKHGISLDRDCWKINSVNCRPINDKGGNRTPTSEEIKCCRPMVLETIKKLKPKFIVLAGGVAIESMLKDHFTNVSVQRWTKLCIPDQDLKSFLIPIHHPSNLVRNDKDENLRSEFDRECAFIKTCLDTRKEFPTNKFEIRAKSLTDFQSVKKQLEKVLKVKPELLAFDYETTGIKPFRKGHKIATISFCYSKEEAFAFPYDWPNKWTRKEFIIIKKLWRKIITNKDIGLIAQNMQFEDIWTNEIVGVDPVNWKFDTEIAAHLIDNRSRFPGLQFQTYLNFGIKPYDKDVDPFIKKSNQNGFNKVFDCPLHLLLKYNSLDSLFTFLLYFEHRKHLDELKKIGNGKIYDAYQLFHEGTLELGRISRNGIRVDEEYYNTIHTPDGTGIIDKKITAIMKELLSSKEAKKFKNQVGREILLTSNQDIGILIYDILKKAPNYTAKNQYATGKEILEKIKSPFVEKLLEIRKLNKISGTYIEQFRREVIDGFLYPSFSLLIPRSYRSSSSDPNFQNIPVRDKLAKQYVRSGIFPSKGNQLLESDFSGIEVGTSTSYNKDPKLIAYVTDSNLDMHRDSAADIWKLNKSQVTKDIRFYAKNCWVFPQFYGDWYESCAKALWENCRNLKLSKGDVTLKEHLASTKQPIKTFSQFVNHCERIEKKFWNERFKVYARWKKEINQLYRKQGFIETYLGFQFRGYIKQNEVTNYQTQGTAFHILLWTLIRVAKEIRKRKLRTKIIGQIHDSMLFDLYPPERDQIVEIVNYYGTVKSRETFDWIKVPLKIDHEITPVDCPWKDKMDLEEYAPEAA